MSTRTVRHGCRECSLTPFPPGGHKPIEQLQASDLVLARDEQDVNGPVEAKVIEEHFTREGVLLNVHVGGEVIQTTPEHPFYVRDKDWTPAGALAIGDALSTHTGAWIAIDDLFDTGDTSIVYNFRVAEHSTYFVGSDDWDFSVWVHNTYFRNLSSQGLDVFNGGLPNRRLFESLRRANLDPPNNFPRIDRINRSSGLGTSMKTIDLRTATAQDPDQLRQLVRGYVDTLREFEGGVTRFARTIGGQKLAVPIEVRVPRLRARRLEIGVQADILDNNPQMARIFAEEARRASRLKRNPVELLVYKIT